MSYIILLNRPRSGLRSAEHQIYSGCYENCGNPQPSTIFPSAVSGQLTYVYLVILTGLGDSLVGRLLTSVPDSIRRGLRHLKPIIEERQKLIDEHGKNYPGKPVMNRSCSTSIFLLTDDSQSLERLSGMDHGRSTRRGSRSSRAHPARVIRKFCCHSHLRDGMSYIILLHLWIIDEEAIGLHTRDVLFSCNA